MEPIRILHVLGKLNRGGAETLVMNWYRHIDKTKIQFDFVIHTTERCSYTDEILSMGGKIYSVPAYRGKNHFQYCKAWKDFFEQHTEYKVIHGHVRSTAVIYLSIAKKFGRITISHSHSMNSGSGVSGFVKRCLQYPIRYVADYKWACSMAAGEYLFGRKQVKKDRFKVVHNAIDLQAFSYDENVRQLKRDELKLNNHFVIGHVGRFIPEKNHNFILEVFEQFYRENMDAVLLLVGVGPLIENVRSKVKEKGLEKAVRFLGERSDVAGIMQALDVFLFPSVYEGLGIVAIEAQAAGLPVFISENVPQEVKVTDSACFLPVNSLDSVCVWEEKLIEISKKEYLREKKEKEIIDAGYDIVAETVALVTDYLTMLGIRE